MGPFIIYKENTMLRTWPYSQNFIFLVTYEWAQLANVLVLCKPFQLRIMVLSSLMGPLISYNRIYVLRTWPQVLDGKFAAKMGNYNALMLDSPVYQKCKIRLEI
jgi:hypothetical protein